MADNMAKSLLCKLKLSGLDCCRLDSSLNLEYVGSITSSLVVLPYGLHGVVGTGFSGLDIEVLKFNKDLCELELTALSNCSKFKELYIYPSQSVLVQDLIKLYPNLNIVYRREK